jgi:trans-aconitate 2-methyltransferase
MSIAREWDGATYDRVSAPMEAMGLEVLARLQLSGDETVVDAGCGSGRVTAALLERLPDGRVIAVDAAPSMIETARERLGARDNLELRVADLCELELQQSADAILSTATFHWIKDHAQLFGRLRAALRPGGQLAAQCGGHGNIRVVREAGEAAGAEPPFAPYLAGWAGPWRYAAPQETEQLLLAAGFASARCWLEPRPVHTDDPRTYYRNIIMGAHLGRLPEHLHEAFLDAVFERLEDPLVIPYVRLNIDAVA